MNNFNLNLADDEKVIYETNAFIIKNDSLLNINIIITNFRMIIIEDVAKYTYKETIRLATGIQYMPQYEIILDIPKKNILLKKYEDGVNILAISKHELLIVCDNLIPYLD